MKRTSLGIRLCICSFALLLLCNACAGGSVGTVFGSNAGAGVSPYSGETAASGDAHTEVFGTAKARENSTAKAQASTTAPVPVSEIRLSAAEKTLEPAQQFSLKAEALPAEAVNPGLRFQSSDPKVATVSENGKVTAVNTGILAHQATKQ